MVLAPPVKRKRRRKKRRVPKTDEDVTEASAQPSEESGIALVTAGDVGQEKEEVDVTAMAVEEKVQTSTVNDESSFAVSAEEVELKELASTSSVAEEATSINLSSITAPCNNVNKTEKEPPVVTENVGASNKEKQAKLITEDAPTGSTTPPAPSRQEIPPVAPTEVKRSPLIPRYSRFEFLANSMIITDVTTERGTVTVKECSAYEGFYGPEPDRPS